MELTISLQNDVANAKQGDIAAFERLINKTKNLVSSIALSIVKDFDQSEDITQQVFINTWQNLASLKHNHSFLPWLRQTTRYTAFNSLRENKKAVNLSEQESERILNQLCNNELTHDESLLQREQFKVLNHFIDKLPNDNRDIVLLYYREGQSTEHVAQLLEISTENVRQKLSRARKQIKQELLSSLGKVVFSTAPSATFASVVISSISYSSPVVAATAAQTVGAGKTGFGAKLASLLGGASIGAGLAAMAIFFSTKPALKRINKSADKQKLISLRNQSIIWVIFSGLMLTLAYEFGTTVSIIGTFILFAIGLFICNLRISKHISQSIYQDEANNISAENKRQFEQFCGKWGGIIGIVVGFSALIAGLIKNGQIPF